jgi:hypothetical protein
MIRTVSTILILARRVVVMKHAPSVGIVVNQEDRPLLIAHEVFFLQPRLIT